MKEKNIEVEGTRLNERLGMRTEGQKALSRFRSLYSWRSQSLKERNNPEQHSHMPG